MPDTFEKFQDHKGDIWTIVNSGIMKTTGSTIILARHSNGLRYRVSFNIDSFDHPCVDLEYLDSHLAETVYHGIKNSL